MGNASALPSSCRRISSTSDSSQGGLSVIQRSLSCSFTSLFRSCRSENQISLRLSKICLNSWTKIMKQVNLDSKGRTVTGVSQFVSTFFRELKELDTDGQLLKKLQIRNRVKKFHYEHLILISIMEFILSVNDGAFNTKARIRALGRSHARHNIRDPEFRIFNEVILRTLVRRLGPGYITACQILEAWTILLDFISEELTFDNVYFVKHNSDRHGSFEKKFESTACPSISDVTPSCSDDTQQCVALYGGRVEEARGLEPVVVCCSTGNSVDQLEELVTSTALLKAVKSMSLITKGLERFNKVAPEERSDDEESISGGEIVVGINVACVVMAAQMAAQVMERKYSEGVLDVNATSAFIL